MIIGLQSVLRLIFYIVDLKGTAADSTINIILSVTAGCAITSSKGGRLLPLLWTILTFEECNLQATVADHCLYYGLYSQ